MWPLCERGVMVAATVLKTVGEIRAGSTPVARTKIKPTTKITVRRGESGIQTDPAEKAVLTITVKIVVATNQ